MTRKRLTLALVVSAAALVAASPSWAQPAGPGWGGGRPDAPWRERFAQMDTDHDGALTKAEFLSEAASVFDAMDADSSGALTKEEYMAVRMGPQGGGNPARQETMQARKAARFQPMDTDGDGRVNRAEFLAGHEREFALADRNGDGRVTAEEFRDRHW